MSCWPIICKTCAKCIIIDDIIINDIIFRHKQHSCHKVEHAISFWQSD